MKNLWRLHPAVLFTMLLLFSLHARAAWAAGTLVVTVPQGDYTLWLEYKDDKGAEQTTPPVTASGTKAAIDLAPLGSKFTDTVLVVLDDKGNVGTKPAPVKAEGTTEIAVATSDITAVDTFRVRAVGADGQPSPRGSVTVIDSKKQSHTRPILPGKEGVVEFDRVPFGRANVKVTFSDGGTLAQDVEVKAGHAPGAFSVDLAMAGGASAAPANAPAGEAADGEATEGAAPGIPPDQQAVSPDVEPAPAASGPGGVGRLIGLLILAGVVYAGYRVFREKGLTVSELLGRLGVQVPTDEPPASTPAAQAPPPVSVPEGACPYCGQPKDPATGECACSVAASPAAVATAGPATPLGGGAPRLVVVQGPAMGGSFTLTEAPAVIGRSPENALALSQDSTVSRRHASVARQGDAYLLRDEGSSNGTFVNGLRVTEHVLRPGDEIQVGSSRIRFEA